MRLSYLVIKKNMNEKLKERIERLAEERDAIQSKIDDVNSELNRLFPLQNGLVNILSKKHECLKGLLEATQRELRYVIASEADEIKMAKIDCYYETNSFDIGGVQFTDDYGFQYTLRLETKHKKEIMNESDYGTLIGFVYDRKAYEHPEITGSSISFDNIKRVGYRENGTSASLHRVEEKMYSKLKIEDRNGNYFCVPFVTPRKDYTPIKLVLRDEDDRVLWSSEVPVLERNN